MESAPARRRFVAAVGVPDDDIDLARAALWIAAEEHPDLDVDAAVARIDALAASVAPALAAFRSPADAVGELRGLFAREGFRGNVDDYFDPRNSYLDDVLARRVGIPLTLSILVLEIGWRCGLPLVGVGFPGHFLTKYPSPDGDLFIDAFEGARAVSVPELRTRLSTLFGADAHLLPQHLEAVSKRQILVRLNANLKTVYTDRGDMARALAAVERILVLTPDALEEIRDRGLLLLGLRAYARAAGDLRLYLERAPAAPDADEIRSQLEVARRERVRLN